MWFLYHDGKLRFLTLSTYRPFTDNHKGYAGSTLPLHNPIDGDCIRRNIFQYLCGASIGSTRHKEFALRAMREIIRVITRLMPRMFRDPSLHLMWIPMKQALQMVFKQQRNDIVKPIRIEMARLMDVCMMYLCGNRGFEPIFRTEWEAGKIYGEVAFDNFAFRHMGFIGWGYDGYDNDEAARWCLGQVYVNVNDVDNDDGETIVGEANESEAEVVDEDITPRAGRQRHAEAGDGRQSSCDGEQQTGHQIDTPIYQPVRMAQDQRAGRSHDSVRQHMSVLEEEFVPMLQTDPPKQRYWSQPHGAPMIETPSLPRLHEQLERFGPVFKPMFPLQVPKTKQWDASQSATQAHDQVPGSQEDQVPRTYSPSPEPIPIPAHTGDDTSGIENSSRKQVPAASFQQDEARTKTPSPGPTPTSGTLAKPPTGNTTPCQRHISQVSQTSNDTSPESTTSSQYQTAAEEPTGRSIRTHHPRPLHHHLRLGSRQFKLPYRGASPLSTTSSKYHNAGEEQQLTAFSTSSSQYQTAAEDRPISSSSDKFRSTIEDKVDREEQNQKQLDRQDAEVVLPEEEKEIEWDI